MRKGKKKKRFLFLQGIYIFLVIFLLYFLSPWSSTISCRDRRQLCLCVLAKLIGTVVCHPFLSGCLGELDTPLQHLPLFRELKRITVPEIVDVNSSSPGLVHETLQSHCGLFAWRWIDANSLLRLVRHDAFVFYHKRLPMLESQGALHFHWFLPSPLGGYNHPLKMQK